MSLCLSSQDLQQVRSCWNNVQVNNKYHKDQFIGRLFSNLLAANPQLKSFFKTDLITREHSLLFNDLLNYVIIYLDNVDRLNQFLILFFKENNDIVHQIHYLEPMGTALIQTFRQWLGKGLFNDHLERLWVQIYIHLANNMLMFADDSDESTASVSDMDAEDNESLEEIQGLNIHKTQPQPKVQEMPMTPASPVSPPSSLQQVEEEEEVESEESEGERPIDLSRKPSIQVNIKSNDKYRGFRRNDSNVVDVEPVLTPRSPRRELPKSSSTSRLSSPPPTPIAKDSPRRLSSLAAKFNNLPPKVVYDSDEDEQNTQFGFDPRKSIKKRASSSAPKPIEKDFHYSIARPAVFNEDDNNSIDLDEKPSELDTTMNQGETSDNDNSSSIYHTDQSEGSEPSSQDQTLSLHSHYSEGTEGTDPMSMSINNKHELRSMSSNEDKSDSSVDNGRVFSHNFNSRQTSISSVEPEFMASVNNYHHNTGKLPTRVNHSRNLSMGAPSKCQSQSDLSLQQSILLSQRASLGFMRSSFVLKKEVEALGHNIPENVITKPPTMPAAAGSMTRRTNASTPNLGRCQSTTSFRTANNGSDGFISEEDDEAFELQNTFMPIIDNSKARYKKFTSSCSNLSSSSPVRHNSIRSVNSRPEPQHQQPIKNKLQSKSVMNLAKHNNYDPMLSSVATASIRPSNNDICKVKTKRSFRDKLKSLFGGSNSSTTNVTTSSISSPIETTYSTNSSVPRGSISSKSTTNLSNRRLSTSNATVDNTRGEETDKFTQLNNFESRRARNHSKIASVSDLRSVNTMDDNESLSGFSFYDGNKRTSMDSKNTARYSTRGNRTKKNKYNVTKTPYDVFAHNKSVF